MLDIRHKSIYIVFLFVLVFSTCKEEGGIEPQLVNELEKDIESKICRPIEFSLIQLSTQDISGSLIVNVENQNSMFSIQYDSGFEIELCADSLASITIDSTENEIAITMADSSSYVGYFHTGPIELEVESILNPSGYAPLSAQLNVVSPKEGYIHLSVLGQDGLYSDVNKTFESIASIHQVPVMGLYLDYQNEIVIQFYSRNNFLLSEDTIIIETEAFDRDLPEVFVDINDVENMAPGFQLISHLALQPDVPFMMDQYGKVRLLYDWRTHPILDDLKFDNGMERLRNGNFYFGDVHSDGIYEIDLFGNIINEWPVNGYGFHHHVFEKPNGNLLLSAETANSDHLQGGVTVEDRILEFDRLTGSIIKVWDVRNILDETRMTFTDFSADYFKDWAHLNALDYDASDDHIVFSARNQSSIVKVNSEDEVKWIISPHVDFGTNRNGDDLEVYYLTAVDPFGVPYSESVQNGSENIEEFEWPWYQHAVKVLGPNRIMCFDNGNIRNYGNSPSVYSRAVIYVINPGTMSITQEWSYGRDRGQETFSACCSDVDFLENENHIIFSPGYKTDNYNGEGARIIEVDYDTQEIIFEARLNSNPITLHRSERLEIYP